MSERNQIGNYVIEHKIGSGAFSCVYKAKHITTNLNVAIKAISKANFPFKLFLRELTIMKKIIHPFCVTLYEFFEDMVNYYLVMEYVEGRTMLDFLNSIENNSPEYAARHFFCQIISALDYLHNTCNFIHRDLKMENIMIDRFNNIRLIDFGLGNIADPQNPLFQTACGSMSYAAPELFRNEPYTTNIDIWSAGIILYGLLCGTLPFVDQNVKNLMLKIVNEPVQFPCFIKPDQRDILIHLLDKNQDSRYTIDQIKSHPWFQNYYFSDVMNRNFGVIQGFCTIDNKLNIISELLKKTSSYNIDEDKIKNEINNEVFEQNSAAYRILLREMITCKLISMYSKNKNSTKQAGSKPMPCRLSPETVLNLYSPKKLLHRSSSPSIELKGNIKSSGSLDLKKTMIKNRRMHSPIRIPITRQSKNGSFLISTSNMPKNNH